MLLLDLLHEYYIYLLTEAIHTYCFTFNSGIHDIQTALMTVLSYKNNLGTILLFKTIGQQNLPQQASYC